VSVTGGAGFDRFTVVASFVAGTRNSTASPSGV
jgi:hypothetical protein